MAHLCDSGLGFSSAVKSSLCRAGGSASALFIGGLGLQAWETKDALVHTRLADKVMGIEGWGWGKNHTFLRKHQAVEPVYPVCLFICFLLTYCNLSSMGLG